LIAPDVDNNLPANWSTFADHGSPGEANGAFQAVFLTYFSVEATENGALLKWSTYDDNSEFILKGNNGIRQWDVQVNKMQFGSWTATDQRHIEYNETINYQLFVVDENGFEYLAGTVEYTPDFIPVLSLKKISPNPTTNNISVSFSAGRSQNTRIKIYDLTGRLVKLVPVNSPSQIKTVNLDNLATGVYLLSLENDYVRETRKLIVNK